MPITDSLSELHLIGCSAPLRALINQLQDTSPHRQQGLLKIHQHPPFDEEFYKTSDCIVHVLPEGSHETPIASEVWWKKQETFSQKSLCVQLSKKAYKYEVNFPRMAYLGIERGESDISHFTSKDTVLSLDEWMYSCNDFEVIALNKLEKWITKPGPCIIDLDFSVFPHPFQGRAATPNPLGIPPTSIFRFLNIMLRRMLVCGIIVRNSSCEASPSEKLLAQIIRTIMAQPQ